jgi:carboxypeptidase family protein/TonB-dependent receptor-like protein
MRVELRTVATMIVLILTSAWPAAAQTTFATITGTVTDSSGGVIAGAEVAATNVETSIATKTTTNSDGVYTVAQLREGPYMLSITAPGLRELIVTNILLVTRDVRRIDAKLEVGVLSEAVQVTGGATPIELETPRLSDVRTAEQLRTLPLNDPGVWSFLAVTPTLSLRAGTYSFAGSKYNQSQFAIDGTSMSDGVGESPVGPLANYIESFKEVKIDLANNSAEFPSLGQVTIISKSGANRFSGSLFDYYMGPSMRARNPFSGQRQAGWVHFPGVAAGGPVLIPKVYNGHARTFWFASAETVDGSNTSVDLNPTVPIEPWRRGDFSALGRPIRNPLTGEVYADGRIPVAALNPVAVKLQDRFFPLPNSGNTAVLQTNNFRETLEIERAKPYYWTARIDHDFNPTNRLFGRFTLSRSTNPVWEGNLPAFGVRDQLRHTRALTLSYTRILGSSLVSEFRGGYTYNNNPISGPVNGLELADSLGLRGLAPGLPDISGVLKVSFPGSGLTGLSQVDWTNPGFLNRIYQLQNQTTWQHGTHTVKGGAEIRRIDNDESAASANLFGALDFTGRFSAVPGIAASGHPYADFLFGVPNTASRAFPPIAAQRRRWTYDFFAQDDWKVTRNLTLNLGLRYDLHPGWFERNDRQAIFDIISGRIVVPDGGRDDVSPLMPTGYVDVVSANSVGLPARTLLRTDRNNFAPRIGVAYRPFGGARTVLRGGYGLYYDMTPIDLQAARAPFVLSETPFTNPTIPTVVLPTVFPASGTSGPATIGLPLAVNPDIGLPYTHQFNATVEHEHWNTGFRVSYVATLGRAMWYERDANAPAPDNRLYIEKPRPFPQFPDITYADKGGSHDYHGLTLEAERRFSKGLFFQIAYTAARDLGDTGGNAANGGIYTTPIENPFDLARERGRDVATPTHRVTTAVMYELPFGRERRWLANAPGAVDAALGGWELSLVSYQQTGGYLTPTISVPDPTGTRFTTTATRPVVSIRPDQLGDPNLDDRTIPGGSPITAFPWYGITALAAPPIGRFGTAGRGVIEGPGLNLWHFGVHKRFRLTDRAAGPALRVELTTTNLFNTAQWANPNLNVTPTNVSAGRVTAVGGSAGFIQQAGMRQMRLGIRAEW